MTKIFIYKIFPDLTRDRPAPSAGCVVDEEDPGGKPRGDATSASGSKSCPANCKNNICLDTW
jgi:hypothetical protein